MAEQYDDVVKEIDTETLSLVAKRALGETRVEITEWQVVEPTAGAGGIVRRVFGKARTKYGIEPWSVIMKIPKQNLGLGNPFGGDREAEIYRSRFLENFAIGLKAPKCYEVCDRDGGGHIIWMEDISGDTEDEWSVDRFGAAAYHLGQFNGAFIEKESRPEWPWLREPIQIRDYVERFAPTPEVIEETMDYWQKHHGLPSSLARRCIGLNLKREMYLEAIASVPTCVCHGDADRRNLQFRDGGTKDEELVAFDWALAGLSVLGDDVHRLIHNAVMFSKVDEGELSTLERVAYAGYLGGLYDAGWSGDERVIRLGFAAASAMQEGIVIMGVTMSRLRERKWIELYEGFLECRFEEMLARVLSLFEYQIDLADEAEKLFEEII